MRPPAQPHEPETQFWPGLQALPQAPQWNTSLFGFTHEPAQSVASMAHMPTHAPASQTSPAAHTVPQAPQLAGSLCVAAQTPPQST